MIEFQQSQALTSHFESFWSIVQWFNIICEKLISRKNSPKGCLALGSNPDFNWRIISDLFPYFIALDNLVLCSEFSVKSIWKRLKPVKALKKAVFGTKFTFGNLVKFDGISLEFKFWNLLWNEWKCLLVLNLWKFVKTIANR